MKNLTFSKVMSFLLKPNLKYFIPLILFLFSQNIFPQFTTPVFENISIEDGLPENSVMCMVQDYLGYLWLGTQNGLVRYDGYSMKVFQPENMNEEKLRQKGIVALYEDTERTLWICTLNGLFRFNRSDETFKCYENYDNDSGSISSDLTHCIYEDKKGRLWIGTQEGLSLFDRKKEKFSNYYFYLRGSEIITTSTPNQHNLAVNAITGNPATGNLLIGTSYEGLWKFSCTKKTFSKYKFNDNQVDKKIGYIQSFDSFKDKIIWMASYHTLCSLDPGTGEFNSYIEFPVKKEERHWKPSFVTASIIKDYNGLIWCAFTAGGKGIFCLNAKTKYFQNYKPVPEEHYKGYANKIHVIYEDRSGILWIGSWGTGLWKWDRRKKKFLTAVNSLDNFKVLQNFSASSYTYDPTGYIWFGSQRGLEKYDIKNGRFYHYLQNELCLSQYDVYAITIDKSGFIWFGTINCGLIRFNPVDESYRYYFNDPNEPINLANKLIKNIYQDHLGFIWISTEGFGLYRFDTVKYSLTQFTSLNQYGPSRIYEDSFNTLWIGTGFGGLYKYERKNEKFIYCGFRCICSMYEDSKGNFWLSDYYTGLNLFDRRNNKVIKCYDRQDGLVSYSIWGILEDKRNNLWISTDNGLLKFNLMSKRFKRYSKKDGLPENFFSPFSPCLGPDSTILFNTAKGPVIFNPNRINDDPVPPKVLISNVSLFNNSREKLSGKGFIPELKEITIPYYENDLRFDYVGLQYSEPEKNIYKYILENFDDDWVDAGTQRNATYTNLNPGEYIFKVRAANRDGIWNKKAASLKIIILPPWWKTTWAYAVYVFLIISTIYFTWKLQLKRIRIKHEFEMSRFEADKLHEVDELKSRFFTNISHEFRTPLTLISGPVKQMIENLNNGKMKNDLTVIHRNADKLLRLVNQLMDISRLESGSMKLQASAQNIVPFLKALVHSFASYAERKRITLKINTSEDNIIIYIDNEKMEKIITNIISNAFKFTPENGLIEVNVIKEDGYVNVSINDTGIGIPKERIPRIFDRFYQVNGSQKREHEGTGIGLALTKELIELHKGKIKVESEEGKGTTFSIRIPLGKEHLKPEEIVEEEIRKEYAEENIYTEPAGNEKNIDLINNGLFEKESLPSLLIVEDNADVRNYILDNLKNDYNVLEAADGEDGWNKCTRNLPDLIISDVMMPLMDGFELCKKLKTNERTSHIPVILLTAKASDKDQIEGLETGADEYLLKPFIPEILKARIKNLIGQRKRIQEHFRKQGLVDLEKVKITSIDKKFLQNALNIISENISDSSFNVQSLAEKATVSYQVLHKKIVSLTGETPVELIRRIRLTKAAELIENKFGNISEIAIEVGFNNPAYFSECFKKQFGLSPSQYSHNSLNNS